MFAEVSGATGRTVPARPSKVMFSAGQKLSCFVASQCKMSAGQLPSSDTHQAFSGVSELFTCPQVVAGLEPENTNIFLQMLAEAAVSKAPIKPAQVACPSDMGPCLFPAAFTCCWSSGPCLVSASLMTASSEPLMLNFVSHAEPQIAAYGWLLSLKSDLYHDVDRSVV